MTTTIAFVRHGEVHNPQGIIYGRLPGFGLSENGRRQAEAAAQFLANGFAPAHIFSSPMLRAQQTAAILSQGKPVQESLLLNEVYTYYEGHLLTDLGKNGWDFYTGVPEPYEQPAALAARLTQFIQQTRRDHAGQTVVAVSHGDPIAYLILALQGEVPLLANRAKLSALGVTDGYPVYASVTLLNYRSDDPAERPLLSYHRPY
jgi:broad specificity phosphatase PhoE